MSLPLAPHTPEQTQTTTHFSKFFPSNMSSYQVLIFVVCNLYLEIDDLKGHLCNSVLRKSRTSRPITHTRAAKKVRLIELHSPDVLYFSVFLYMTPTPPRITHRTQFGKTKWPPRVGFLTSPLHRYIFMIHSRLLAHSTRRCRSFKLCRPRSSLR